MLLTVGILVNRLILQRLTVAQEQKVLFIKHVTIQDGNVNWV